MNHRDYIEGNYKRVSTVVVTCAAVGTALVATSASAILPTEASTAFTTLATNVTDIIAAVWPILAAAGGGFVLFKLFRRGMNKI